MELKEKLDLSAITIFQDPIEEKLVFQQAELYIHQSDIFFSWYIDITDLENETFCSKMLSTDNITVTLHAITSEGAALSCGGYFYANPKGPHASIRGEGEIIGYS